MSTTQRPTTTRIEARYVTVAAQRRSGVRIDISHTTDLEDLHIEVYDFNGRKIAWEEIGQAYGKKHPEFIFRRARK